MRHFKLWRLYFDSAGFFLRLKMILHRVTNGNVRILSFKRFCQHIKKILSWLDISQSFWTTKSSIYKKFLELITRTEQGFSEFCSTLDIRIKR